MFMDKTGNAKAGHLEEPITGSRHRRGQMLKVARQPRLVRIDEATVPYLRTLVRNTPLLANAFFTEFDPELEPPTQNT